MQRYKTEQHEIYEQKHNECAYNYGYTALRQKEHKKSYEKYTVSYIKIHKTAKCACCSINISNNIDQNYMSCS